LVDARHWISKNAISLQFRDELRMRSGRLVPTFCYDSEILKILQQLFIFGNREHHSGPFAVFVG